MSECNIFLFIIYSTPDKFLFFPLFYGGWEKAKRKKINKIATANDRQRNEPNPLIIVGFSSFQNLLL